MKSARFHHEIHQISWNPPDSFMKSTRFHGHEICRIPPWNPADFMPNEPRTNGPIFKNLSPITLPWTDRASVRSNITTQAVRCPNNSRLYHISFFFNVVHYKNEPEKCNRTSYDVTSEIVRNSITQNDKDFSRACSFFKIPQNGYFISKLQTTETNTIYIYQNIYEICSC